jgi:hypothetical protein
MNEKPNQGVQEREKKLGTADYKTSQDIFSIIWYYMVHYHIQKSKVKSRYPPSDESISQPLILLL